MQTEVAGGTHIILKAKIIGDMMVMFASLLTECVLDLMFKKCTKITQQITTSKCYVILPSVSPSGI